MKKLTIILILTSQLAKAQKGLHLNLIGDYGKTALLIENIC